MAAGEGWRKVRLKAAGGSCDPFLFLQDLKPEKGGVVCMSDDFVWVGKVWMSDNVCGSWPYYPNMENTLY